MPGPAPPLVVSEMRRRPASVLPRLRRPDSACLKQAPLPEIRAIRVHVQADSSSSPVPLASLPVEAHGRAQPLQSEAPYAQNDGKGPIWSISAVVLHTIYGVPRPLSFSIPETDLLLPQADRSTRGVRSAECGARSAECRVVTQVTGFVDLYRVKRSSAECGVRNGQRPQTRAVQAGGIAAL